MEMRCIYIKQLFFLKLYFGFEIVLGELCDELQFLVEKGPLH